MHESIIRVLPPPTCIARTIAIPLHVYSAVYDAPPTHLLYAIHHTVLPMAISCKGQVRDGSGRVRDWRGNKRTRLYLSIYIYISVCIHIYRVDPSICIHINICIYTLVYVCICVRRNTDGVCGCPHRLVDTGGSGCVRAWLVRDVIFFDRPASLALRRWDTGHNT